MLNHRRIIKDIDVIAIAKELVKMMADLPEADRLKIEGVITGVGLAHTQADAGQAS